MSSDLDDFLKPDHLYRQYQLSDVNQARLVPWLYKPLLERIHITMPGVVIVGGAVRDAFFDREVKDIDFMTIKPGDVELMGECLGMPMLDCLRHKTDSQRKQYEQEPSLIAAYETENKHYNLLLVPSIWKRIQEFPDSISQCWTDGTHMYATQAFCATAMTKVVNCSDRITAERLCRLREKYPDFIFTTFREYP